MGGAAGSASRFVREARAAAFRTLAASLSSGSLCDGRAIPKPQSGRYTFYGASRKCRGARRPVGIISTEDWRTGRHGWAVATALKLVQMSWAWGYGLRAEEAGLRPGPTKDRDATAGDLPGDGLPRLVPHDRKTGGSETPPLRLRDGTAGIGWEAWVLGVWFDTPLRRTPGRLTTNGCSTLDRVRTGSPRTGRGTPSAGSGRAEHER